MRKHIAIILQFTLSAENANEQFNNAQAAEPNATCEENQSRGDLLLIIILSSNLIWSFRTSCFGVLLISSLRFFIAKRPDHSID